MDSLPVSPSDEKLEQDLIAAHRAGDRELAAHIASMMRNRETKGQARLAQPDKALSEVDPVEETGRAALAGGTDFITNLMGLPGEVTQLGSSMGAKSLPRLPVGSEIRDIIGGFTGKTLPRPETDVGQFGAKAVEGTLSMTPLGARRLMPLATGAVSGIAGEGAARAMPEEPWARALGNLAGHAPGAALDATSHVGRIPLRVLGYLISRAFGGSGYLGGQATGMLPRGQRDSVMKDIARALLSTELQSQPLPFDRAD